MSAPKTLVELQTLLERRQLYPWYAAANGKDPYDGYGAKQDGDKWIVYRSAPMTAPDNQYFSTEPEAVSNLIQRLRNDGFADYLKDI
jgi:hypothetical protein